MSRQVTATAVLLAAGLMVVWGAGGVLADEPKVGEPAPAFSLPGSDGKIYSLADYKGKSAVVLAWFPKAFTRRLHRRMQVVRPGGRCPERAERRLLHRQRGCP